MYKKIDTQYNQYNKSTARIVLEGCFDKLFIILYIYIYYYYFLVKSTTLQQYTLYLYFYLFFISFFLSFFTFRLYSCTMTTILNNIKYLTCTNRLYSCSTELYRG
jgi:hypothetical protein